MARKVAMAKATVRRRAARWRRLRELLGAASSRGGETEELWIKFKEYAKANKPILSKPWGHGLGFEDESRV
jgi:hypothetical protein